MLPAVARAVRVAPALAEGRGDRERERFRITRDWSRESANVPRPSLLLYRFSHCQSNVSREQIVYLIVIYII